MSVYVGVSLRKESLSEGTDVRILALDIGAGTEDVLLYDDEKKSVENCIKMVLPAPSKIYAERIREATLLRQDLFLKGDVIGGGAFTSALINHIKEGLRVFMTQNSAYTVRNDLDQVRELGIRVVEADLPENSSIRTLVMEEVGLDRMKVFLTALDRYLRNRYLRKRFEAI